MKRKVNRSKKKNHIILFLHPYNNLISIIMKDLSF